MAHGLGDATPASETFTLTVNGRERQVAVPRGTSLLEVLRNDLGLKGAKFGCGLGQCGACCAVVDGHTTPTCQLPVEYAVDVAITTIEGLGTPVRPHPLQASFLERQAGQCGYCVPGIVMTAADLLEQNPRPSREEVELALERHLCRCGSQQRFVEAILAAAESST